MPYRRRTYRRKRPFSRKRTYRKRFSKMRLYKRVSGFTKHLFKRKWQPASFATSTAAVTNPAYKFTLADLPNSGEFTSLFDQYKICAVKCVFYPMANTNPSPAGVNTYPGLAFSVIDYDNFTVLAAATDALQYETVKTHNWNQVIKRYFKPRLQMGAYGTGLANAGLTLKRGYIDSTQTAVQHFGLKMFFSQATVQTQNYEVIFTYYIACKNVY